MNLEPAVLKSIRQNRRAVFFYRSLAALPLIAVIALCVALGIFQRYYTSPLDTIIRQSPDTLTSGFSNQMVLLVAFRFVPIVAMFVVAVFRLMKPVRHQYQGFTARAEQYDQQRFVPFLQSLDGVSIGLGVPRPDLVVLDLETPNAAAFHSKGKVYVGITKELLNADLSQNERDAIMAHEVAHVIDGDALREPTILRGLNGLLFILAPLVVLLTGLLGKPTSALSLLMIFVPTIIIMIGYPIAIWLTTRQYKDFRLARYHDDILADSVAAKVTSNPGSLRTAITKVRDAVKAAPTMPSETIGFTHLFVGPLKDWPIVEDQIVPDAAMLMNNRRYGSPVNDLPDPFVSLQKSPNKFLRFISTPIGGKPSQAANQVPRKWGTELRLEKAKESAQKQMGPFIEWQQHLVAERLINLDLIEENRWQAFEVRAGRVVTAPARWE